MQTMDPILATPHGALASPAVARNTGPILEVLRAHMPARGRVLEIAAGSGEHAVAFAAHGLEQRRQFLRDLGRTHAMDQRQAAGLVRRVQHLDQAEQLVGDRKSVV